MNRRKRLALRIIVADLNQSIKILERKYPSVPKKVIRDVAVKNPNLLEWIVGLLDQSEVRWPEDNLRLESAARFLKTQRGNQRLQQLVSQTNKNPKNILDFTLHEIESLEDQLQPQQSKRQLKQEIKTQGASKIYDDGSLKVIEVTTPEASCYYSKNTRWCTSNPDTAERYLKDGSLYVIIENDQKIAQLHVPSNQFVNAKDRPIKFKKLKKLGSLMYSLLSPRTTTKDLADLLLLTKQSPSKEDLELIKKDPQAAAQYIKEFLKSRRWPAAEPYIMKHAPSAAWYARYVLKSPWPAAEPYIKKDPLIAERYARSVLRSRFPAAEPYIMKYPPSALYYARDVLKSRWPEAEPYIMESPFYAVFYAHTILKSPWPEAEPFIMKDLQSAIEYAQTVLKSRFLVAEPSMMKDPMKAVAYAYGILRSRWPEAEPYIMEDPPSAERYARLILKSRWPEAEPYIMKDPQSALRYARVILKSRWPAAELYFIKDPYYGTCSWAIF